VCVDDAEEEEVGDTEAHILSGDVPAMGAAISSFVAIRSRGAQ
jgi:hypothetical protein